MHTPGEWKAVARKKRWSVWAEGELDGTPALFKIAEIDNGAPGDTLDTEEANAKLFAASKKMFAALKAAKSHLDELREAWERGALSEHDGMGGTRSNRNVDVIREIREAITEAGG